MGSAALHLRVAQPIRTATLRRGPPAAATFKHYASMMDCDTGLVRFVLELPS